MEDLIKEYIELEQKKFILNKDLDDIYYRIRDIRPQFERYIYENGLYEPIKNISKYNGESLKCITVITDTGDFYEWSDFDWLEVKDDRLYVNDECCIKEYDEDTGRYHTHTYGHKDRGINIIGYIGLVKENECKNPDSLCEIVSQYIENKNGSIKLLPYKSKED